MKRVSSDDVLLGSIAHAVTLYEDGVVVIDDPWFRQHIDQLRQEFNGALQSFPEYTRHPTIDTATKDNTYVLGGFSALGNPASFHNPFVRKLREWCMSSLMTNLFTAFARRYLTNEYKLEHIVDRMMLRPAKVTPTAESWHRDEAPLAQRDDITLGGWINLDNHDQSFSCVPRTHKQVRKQSGFGKVSAADAAKCERQKRRIVIPSGAIVVFYEHIMHEVVAVPKNFTSIRLFLGWRFTKSNDPMIPGLPALINDQAVMPLKSNQTPPMYARLHWTNWRAKLQNWSRHMVVQECREGKRVESGAHKGEVLDVVHVHMRSLRTYGLPLYPAYAADELRILEPHRTHNLLTPGFDNHRERKSL